MPKGDDPTQWIVVTEDARTLPVAEVLTGRGFITGKSGSGKSVLEGTIVYTETGRKPIEDVESGEKVLSLNKHDYQQEFREVLATVQHKSDELLRITLEDGTELVGTTDHSFLTVEDHEIVPIRGDDIEEGTWFPLARELPGAETTTRIDIAEYVTESRDIDINEYTIRSGQKTDDRYIDLDFAAGKVLGLFLAEGSIDSRHTVQISNIDEGVRAFLGENGFKVTNRTCNRAFEPFGRFVEAEFGHGAGGKSLPNWVFDAPQSFKGGVLSGYLDGDGTVDDTVTAMSKSPALLDGIKELLRHFGISSTVREKFTVYNEEERRCIRLRVDAFSLARLRNTVQLSVAAKAEALDRAVENIDTGDQYNSKDMIPGFTPVLNDAVREQGLTTQASEHHSTGASAHVLPRKQKAGRVTFNQVVADHVAEGRAKKFGRSDIQWKRVVNIEELDSTRTVYDLDVQFNDNFIADGVFVHNSNTASVFAEELLEANYNLLVVDTEGEYWGLKERYDLLHVGHSEECDVQIDASHAEKLASIALERNIPTILDVSDYPNLEEANQLIHDVVEEIFQQENELRKPFLLIIEEIQEYLPQSGGSDDLAKLLLRVAKRGRKRGLGLCGISQRPAAVDKDFITQCDWLVWHRLTWENDLNVVERLLGDDIAREIADLADGEAYLMTDWDGHVDRVQFRRKKTFDAGATPGLEEYDRPDLKSVGNELISELGGDSDIVIDPVSELERQQSTEPDPPSDPPGTHPPPPEPEALDLIVDDIENRSVDTDDPAELRRLLEEERKRNDILQDEIRELKQIIENVNQSPNHSEMTTTGNGADAARETTMFDEPRQEGVTGIVTELGLLVTFLVMRFFRAVVGLVTPQQQGVNGNRRSARQYPVSTRSRPDREYQLKVALFIGLVVLLIIGAALLAT